MVRGGEFAKRTRPSEADLPKPTGRVVRYYGDDPDPHKGMDMQKQQ